MKAFRSVKAIREASAEALARVVPRDAADAAYRYFHKEEETT